MAAQPKIDWDSGLCDCCKDANTCCYGFWCFPCLACTVSEQFGENRCLPLCDLCTPAITAAFAIPLCAPPAGLSIRAAMRNRYGIEGSICKDIAISCFCEICSWCQMHRELKHRNKTPTVIDTQPQNIMHPPVMIGPAYPPEVPLESQSGVNDMGDSCAQCCVTCCVNFVCSICMEFIFELCQD